MSRSYRSSPYCHLVGAEGEPLRSQSKIQRLDPDADTVVTSTWQPF
jgi:hypothetical protein